MPPTMPSPLRLLLLAALAAGCSSAQSGADPTAGVTDLTGALLTSRSATCADYADTYAARATDLQAGTTFTAALVVSADGSGCDVVSNAIPNHDFNATGGFVAPVSEQDQRYTIPADPTPAAQPTPLTLAYDDAILLNGVKVDMLAAGCFFVQTGCTDPDEPFRYNPLVARRFQEDEHHAHTQPDGAYHYHGDPRALFDNADASAPSPVIGFAADGFPIFGSYIDDGGTVRKATSSYRLKTGTRPGGPDGPGGRYDGTYVDDYEYVPGSGDLDACNGMTADGVYGYVVTEAYPYILGCFTGTPDPSFLKPGLARRGAPGARRRN